MSPLKLRVGARASKLAQAQVSIVTALIVESLGDGVELEYVPVSTLGDRTPLSKRKNVQGAKGAFTDDLEDSLLKGKVDIAVHSMKDLPVEDARGLVIAATPPRGDPRDALVSEKFRLKNLPKNAKVGTSSLRRRAQLLSLRPDLEVVELHGNVDTRLRKVRERIGGLDAIVLAVAGLQRLGQVARISQTFSIDEMVPAVGQGVIAVQVREGDKELQRVLSVVDDPVAGLESRCERAFASRMGADCNVPIGGFAWVSGPSIKVTGVIAEEDGSGLRRKTVEGPRKEPDELGRRLAKELLATPVRRPAK